MNYHTCDSKTSISGADRPTYVPSECTGPGCDSPLQVHLDKRWPGRYESALLSYGLPVTAAAGALLIVWLGAVPTSQAS